MAEYGYVTMPPKTRDFSRKAAIVGVGETDYHKDYRASRERAPGYEAPTAEQLCKTAFDRALADSGLKASDIDGLALSYTFGGPEPETLAPMLGIQPRRGWLNGHIMAGPLPAVCGEITTGNNDIVAMIFCVASRSAGRVFGGLTFASGMGGPPSYYYYHPWGWSSQAAHWAMMATYYQGKYGTTEEDLGHVSIQIRQHASLNPNAVMQKPITMEDYLASRYVVKPLHLFDICLVNDGAVCLIVSKADLAKDLPHTPVHVAGWGESYISRDKMRTMIEDRLRPQMQEAGAQALSMAGLSLNDIGHFEGYDASSQHLINQVEGFGFTEPGTGLTFCKDGQMTHGGRIPTNTGGGNMSHSYMQGWSQVAEVVHQLRHEAGPRQVQGVQASMSALTQTDASHPIVYTRGE